MNELYSTFYSSLIFYSELGTRHMFRVVMSKGILRGVREINLETVCSWRHIILKSLVIKYKQKL